MAFVYALFVSYWTVLIAELVGDKSLYTVASLSARVRFRWLFLGATAAYGAKMLLAVLFGQTLARIPAPLTTSLSATIFFFAAFFIWIKKPTRDSARSTDSLSWSRGPIIPFASLFLTEWGDPGQIAAAALVAQFHFAFAIWLGGTLALMTKGAAAIVLGTRLSYRIPERVMRGVATGSCCMLGLLALRESLIHWP